MYEKIKKWYKHGLWTRAMVLNAVDKCVITAEQAECILLQGGDSVG